MQKTLQFKFEPVLPQSFLTFYSNSKNLILKNYSFSAIKPSLCFSSSTLSLLNQHSSWISLSSQTQIPKSIICARNNRRRSGSQRSRRLIFELVNFIAIKLNILPDPLAFVLREFGGGNGGGLGFLKGFGGGGFDGWRRKRNGRLGFIGIMMMVCGLVLWLILGKELDSDVFWGVLGLSLFGVSIHGWKRGFKDWVLGFCCAVLVGLGLQRENLQRLEKGFKGMEISRRRRTSAAIFFHLLPCFA